MQLIGGILILVLVGGSLSSPVSHVLDDPEAMGLQLEMAPGEADMLPMGNGEGRNEREMYVTPLLLWKLLQLSREHQQPAAPPKRNHYKQCAFNAVSCFG